VDYCSVPVLNGSDRFSAPVKRDLAKFFFMEVCMRRGGYSGNLSKQIKVRISFDTYNNLQRLSKERGQPVARVLRDFIRRGLDNEEKT
jgi:hypothetical protein